MPKSCSNAEKTKIIELWAGGELSVTDIGKIMKRDWHTIDLWLERWSKEGTLETKKRSGKAHVIGPEEEADIVLRAIEKPFDSSQNIRNELSLNCSPRTVDRVLKSLGFNRFVAAKKCQLTERHKTIRFNFYQSYLNWGQNQWSNVFFSDEKTFQSFPNGSMCVYRPKGTRFDPKYMDVVDKSGRFSVNCFGWIANDGLGEISRVSSHFNSENYLELLELEILPSILCRFGDEIPIFMQDNAPIHTAKIVKEFLQNYEYVALIDWPVKGADLNPIENIWAYMQSGVSKLIRVLGHPKSSDDLWALIVIIWEQLKEHNYQRKLYKSMPKHVQTVHSNHGDWSKY